MNVSASVTLRYDVDGTLVLENYLHAQRNIV